MNAGWIILFLSCALLVSAQAARNCPTPSVYPHTRLDRKYTERPKFESGEKVYYDCLEDFIPQGGSRAVQCVDGRWTPISLKCEKRSCGNAGDLPNGIFRYEGNALIGEKVNAECDNGYKLKGLSYMICKRSGWTGEFPTCVEDEITCSVPEVANSVNRGNVSVYRVGDKVKFACSSGFRLDGAQQLICDPHGQWRPKPPQCLPSPRDKNQLSTDNKAGNCSYPANNRINANLADRYITRKSFASRERVYYVCNVGYTQTGGSRQRRCIAGEWTALTMKCERKLCGSAGEILNGQFTYTGVEFGDTASAVCDEGFRLIGRGVRHCLNKGWNGRVPVCQAVQCEEPPQVANAVRDSHFEPPYTYKDVVRYRCRVGTIEGPKDVWCTEDGTWSAPPTCKEITCSPPNVPNAYWTRDGTQRFEYSDTLSIDCKHGYTLSGPSTITCEENGRWSPGLPECRSTPWRMNRRFPQ